MREHASFRAPTIALIEPDDNLALILEYNIEAAGFRARRIIDGGMTLTEIQSTHPAVIVLNRSLPVLSAIELVRNLRLAPETRLIPIIMVADRRFDYDQSRAIEIGITEWISIPFSVEALVGRLKSICGKPNPGIGVAIDADHSYAHPNSPALSNV